jgi:hypothetical protein
MSLDDQVSPRTRRSFIKNTASLAAAVLSARTAAAQSGQTVATPGGPANMINDMTFEDVRKLLDLSPNATCASPSSASIKSRLEACYLRTGGRLDRHFTSC